MNDLTKQDTLELEVANFGPIVEAKIDLRPLTVFAGPSNTGKSYLAILIYALHRFFSGFRGYRMFPGIERQKLPRRTIDAIDEWAQQTFTDEKVEGSLVLPPPLTDEIRSILDTQGDQLGNEIDRCFGIEETSTLIRKGKRNSVRIIFRRHVSNGSAPFEQELMVGTQGSKFKTTIPEETPIRINTEEADDKVKYLHHLVNSIIPRLGRRDENWIFFIRELIENLTDPTLAQLAGPLHVPAFYLPADRTGVMHAHSVVVSAMIGSAPMTGLRPATGTPMLSGVLADFLQQLIELDRPPYRQRRSRRDLGTQIEEAILGGLVRVDRSETIGYPYFTYQPKGWKNALPLMNASSMVSELAPVILYLRHVVQAGETLIIEEPESHLHPAMQVEFTRQIAALVHAGVRVIVTTHSEWVLETLANLVRLSELPKARRKGIEGADLVLRPDQVGAWLFKPKQSPKGSVVEEIRFDPDAGGLESDYRNVAEQLYNEWATIGNRIAGSSE